MTEVERQFVMERAEIEGKILADMVIPRLRAEIWGASATTSLIAAFLLLCWYRSDFAALKAEMKQMSIRVIDGRVVDGPGEIRGAAEQPKAVGSFQANSDRVQDYGFAE